MSMMRISVLTVSDRCSSGETVDGSGPELVSRLKEIFPDTAVSTAIVPDDIPRIQKAITEWCSAGVDLIVSTGGTGFSPRDVTPEAVAPLLDRKADAMAATMVAQGMSNTPLALLSRPVCGVRGRTLIITMPGSVKAVRECLSILKAALPHAINLLRGEEAQVKKIHCNCGGPSDEVGDPTIGDPYDSIVQRPRKSQFPMIDKDKALQTVFDVMKTTELNEELLSPLKTLGRTCTKDVVAVKPFPPYRLSVKDGYAVRCGGSLQPQVRKYAATAGASMEASQGVTGDLVNEDWCVRISTGGVVPDGADAVVQVEDTELLEVNRESDQECRIRLLNAPVPGQDIRPIGCDIPAGHLLLAKGDRVDPAAIGRLVMAGVKAISVFRPLVVGVLSTGDELIDEHTKISNGESTGFIPDSNRPMLLALLKQTGVSVVDLGIAKDERDDLEKKLFEANRLCDIVITSGGVSMGEKDMLKSALKRLGYTIHFGRVNIKPGKPTTFASTEEGRVVFALPGNPASAFVMFQLFVRAALRVHGSGARYRTAKAHLRLGKELELDSRPEFLRGTFAVDPATLRVEVRPSQMQQSSSLLSFEDADVLIELPGRNHDRKIMKDGDVVNIIWI